MPRDHEVFISRNDPRRNMAVGNTWAAARIGIVVDLDAEPCRFDADPAAYLGGVFADPGGEDERVEPAESRNQRAEFAGYAIYKDINRFFCACVVAGEKLAH